LDLSIIIVSWNAKKLLRNCLLSVYKKSKDISFEVFVVDNASDDGSVEMIAKDFSNVILIKNEKNVGFARANNQVIKETKGKYILLLNQDTEVLNNAIGEMVKFMEMHPKCGAIGPKLLNPDGTLQMSARSFPTLATAFFENIYLYKLFPRNKIIGKYYMSYWNHNKIREVDWVSGACLMINRKTIEEVGLLDEQYFMYSEETDWCYRIKKADWHIYYIPQAEVIHFGWENIEPSSVRKFIELHKSMLLFFKKHYTPSMVCLLWLILKLGLLIRIIAWSVLCFLPTSNRKIAKSKIILFWKTLKQNQK